MTIDDLREIIEVNDIYFDFRGHRCGIETEVQNSKTTYYARFGPMTPKRFSSFDEMINSKMFDGKSFAEIIDKIEIEYT